MKTLYVHAHLRTDNEEDADVPGIYAVEVDESLSDEDAASCALDGFRSEIAVDCLDDFDFLVFDGDRQLDENPEHEGYSGDYGDVWRV